MIIYQWIENYVRLAFRIEKVFQTRYGRRFISYYYGPPMWKAEEDIAPVYPSADLLHIVATLSETLASQQFEPPRATFLTKQLLAMETICRVLCGETFSLEEETQRCFDILPTWIPETQFEQVLALRETVLPGKGSFFDRMQALRRKYELPLEKASLVLPILQDAMAEVRRRTYKMVSLPAEEEVSVLTVTGRPGNLAFSEGLAMLAPGMILSAGEEQAWLAEHIYPAAGVEPLDVDWEFVRKISELPMDVQGNAAFLLREGRSDQEVMQYLMRYLLVTEEQAQPMLVYLKSPFNTARIFSYTAGKRLLQSWLTRSDSRIAFADLLTQQLCPSELI